MEKEKNKSMSKREFTEVVRNYIANGWILSESITCKDDGLVIELYQTDSIHEELTRSKSLEISSKKGVRIKGSKTNWNYTEWYEYNDLTKFL